MFLKVVLHLEVYILLFPFLSLLAVAVNALSSIIIDRKEVGVAQILPSQRPFLFPLQCRLHISRTSVVHMFHG